MERIRKFREYRFGLRYRIEVFRRRIAAGIKWWAEHQSWPAIDEIRVDRNRSTCG